jgi:aryl-alcohol dehydrogenase-like predicted oxidoreductase
LRSETDSFLNVLGLKQVKDAEAEIVKRVEEVAKKKGYSMAQIATAWILTKDSISMNCFPDLIAVTAPIVGINSEKRIHEMVEAVSIELTEDEIKYLEEPYVPRPVSGGLA